MSIVSSTANLKAISEKLKILCTKMFFRLMTSAWPLPLTSIISKTILPLNVDIMIFGFLSSRRTNRVATSLCLGKKILRYGYFEQLSARYRNLWPKLSRKLSYRLMLTLWFLDSSHQDEQNEWRQAYVWSNFNQKRPRASGSLFYRIFFWWNSCSAYMNT